MTDPVKRYGLSQADRALAALQDPVQLDRARARFSRSPPIIPSRSTLPDSPLDKDQERYNRRDTKIHELHYSSFPTQMFRDLERQENCRLTGIPNHGTVPEATKNIRDRWIRWGIWRKVWDCERFPYECINDKWDHQVALDEPEPEAEPDSSHQPSLFPLATVRKEPTEAAKQRHEQRRFLRELQREPSRPFFVFSNHLTDEREHMRLQKPATDAQGEECDVNTRAYKAVKKRWKLWGIWDKRWGILPGMCWLHEQSIEDKKADAQLMASTCDSSIADAEARPPVAASPARSFHSVSVVDGVSPEDVHLDSCEMPNPSHLWGDDWLPHKYTTESTRPPVQFAWDPFPPASYRPPISTVEDPSTHPSIFDITHPLVPSIQDARQTVSSWLIDLSENSGPPISTSYQNHHASVLAEPTDLPAQGDADERRSERACDTLPAAPVPLSAATSSLSQTKHGQQAEATSGGVKEGGGKKRKRGFPAGRQLDNTDQIQEPDVDVVRPVSSGPADDPPPRKRGRPTRAARAAATTAASLTPRRRSGRISTSTQADTPTMAELHGSLAHASAGRTLRPRNQKTQMPSPRAGNMPKKPQGVTKRQRISVAIKSRS